MDFSFRSQPSPKTYSVGTINVYLHSGVINLDVPYQRKVVWNTKKQTALINSLWTNMYIYPALMNELTTEGSYTWNCVDGKQRLTSIRRFYDNEISLSIGGAEVYYLVAPVGRNIRIMTDAERLAIDNKNFSVVIFENLDYDMEKQIFSVIQNGVPLNYIEKMGVLDTPFTRAAHMLRDVFYVGKIKEMVSDIRGDDMLLFSRILCASMTDGVPTTNMTAIHKFAKTNTSVDPGAIERACAMSTKLNDNFIVSGNISSAISVMVIRKHLDQPDEFVQGKIRDVMSEIRKSHRALSGTCLGAAYKLINPE